MLDLCRSCPKCGEEIRYSRHGDLRIAERNKTYCRRCSQDWKRVNTPEELNRQCPSCGQWVMHKNRSEWILAVRTHRPCYACRGERLRKFPNPTKEDLERRCPRCDSRMVYEDPFIKTRAEQEGTKCRRCCALLLGLRLKGRKHSQASIEKMRRSQRRVARYGEDNPCYGKPGLRGEANPMYGKKASVETRAKMSAAQKGRPKSPETRKRIAEANRRKSKDPNFIRKVLKGLCAKPNKPETSLGELLNSLFPNEYRYTGDGSFVIDGMAPDFTNTNGQKKVIELFGRAFHDPHKAWIPVRKRHTITGRRSAFKKFGYSALFVWDDELADRRKLVKKLEAFHHA